MNCGSKDIFKNAPPRHTFAENKYRAKKVILGPKIWSKIDPNIKNVRASSSFMHANILLHL